MKNYVKYDRDLDLDLDLGHILHFSDSQKNLFMVIHFQYPYFVIINKEKIKKYMALCKNTTQYQRNDRNLLVQRTEFSLISTNIHYKCTIHQKIIVTQLHSQINRYSMALYYDTNIHFWILIGYIRVYFGDTRDYLDRHRVQPRPAAKLLLLV